MEIWDLKYHMKHKSGHYILFHDRGQVIDYTSDKKPKKLIGTIIDITNYKENL